MSNKFTTLMPQPSEADLLAAESEKIAVELQQESAELFTVGQLFWLYHFAINTRWGTSAATEQGYLDVVKGIRAAVDAKKS